LRFSLLKKTTEFIPIFPEENFPNFPIGMVEDIVSMERNSAAIIHKAFWKVVTSWDCDQGRME